MILCQSSSQMCYFASVPFAAAEIQIPLLQEGARGLCEGVRT